MILISSDWQLDDNPINRYRHEFQQQLRSIIKRNEVECLLLLGDLTEQKDRHGAWLVNKVVDHLDRLRRLCNIVIVQGNHDYVDVKSPFYRFVGHLRGIDWVSEPTDPNEAGMDLAFVPFGKVLLLPHTTDYKRDWVGLKLKTYNYVFTHNTVAGSHVGHGVLSKGIPAEVFGKARVISGDIHIPQTVANWEYVGAPYTVDFGDDYKPRVLLLDGSTIKSIPVTGPQKRLLNAEFLDGDIVLHDFGATPGDILKVRVTITNEQRANWPEIKAKVREWGEENGYLIHIVQPVLGTQDRKGSARRHHSHQSDETLLRSYARQNNIDDLTLKAGQNLLRKI